MPTSRPEAPTKAVTIVCISDTHELHREVDVPRGDILVHAGDFTMFSRSITAIRNFNEWLGELPHKHKIVVPGNHEFFLEADPAKRRMILNATMLIDESVELMGLKIWGSPITVLAGGAFGKSFPADRIKLYSQIPEDTDVLITHGPPMGILDRSPGVVHHAGCPELLGVVNRIQPKLHIFGHVHGAHGVVSAGQTLFVNAALLGVEGDVGAIPIVVRLPSI